MSLKTTFQTAQQLIGWNVRCAVSYHADLHPQQEIAEWCTHSGLILYIAILKLKCQTWHAWNLPFGLHQDIPASATQGMEKSWTRMFGDPCLFIINKRKYLVACWLFYAAFWITPDINFVALHMRAVYFIYFSLSSFTVDN